MEFNNKQTKSLKLIIEKTIPNKVVHCVSGGELWASSGYSLFLSKDKGTTFDKMFDLRVPLLIRELSKIRITYRGLRLGVRAMRKFASGTILAVANRKLHRIAEGQIDLTYSFNKGFSPMREGWCEDDNGNYYMAEYFLNNKRTTSSELLKSMNDGRSWQIIRTLDNIRHIHCVQYDPFSRSIFMGTGDTDEESSISYSQDGGKTWISIGSGDQLFRAVSLLFTEDYIYWGGDAPTRQNYINRYNRKSQKIEKMVAVKGTVFYSTILGNGTMIFGTTTEGNSEGKNPTDDRKAHIWASSDGIRWEEIASWKKDIWSYVKGSGIVLLAHGKSVDKLYFTTEGLKGVDGVLTCATVHH
jgi:hypothetical protein